MLPLYAIVLFFGPLLTSSTFAAQTPAQVVTDIQALRTACENLRGVLGGLTTSSGYSIIQNIQVASLVSLILQCTLVDV
jgi:hypothetical protein